MISLTWNILHNEACMISSSRYKHQAATPCNPTPLRLWAMLPRHMPVGSAARAASASRAASPRRNLPLVAASAEESVAHECSSRPGSADSARGAMRGSPRIVMTPLHPRSCSRGDGSLGPPSRKEQELREVCRQIAELAPQKFGTVREAHNYYPT